MLIRWMARAAVLLAMLGIIVSCVSLACPAVPAELTNHVSCDI
jgi:hypothetical protein